MFLSNWVIFRFQPLIFRDVKLVVLKLMGHFRSQKNTWKKRTKSIKAANWVGQGLQVRGKGDSWIMIFWYILYILLSWLSLLLLSLLWLLLLLLLLLFPKVPQSSQTESLGFPRVPPPPLGATPPPKKNPTNQELQSHGEAGEQNQLKMTSKLSILTDHGEDSINSMKRDCWWFRNPAITSWGW